MFLKLNLLLLWFQSSSLDADEWQLLQGSVPRGSVPQEKLVFSSPGWPRGSNLHWIAPYLQQKQAAPSTRRPGNRVLCGRMQTTPPIHSPSQLPLPTPFFHHHPLPVLPPLPAFQSRSREFPKHL